LSLHVVLAKWKGVVLLVMPPELREPHTTEVEGTRCKSSRLYWTVTSLFAVELVKVRLIVVGFPPIQFRFAAGEFPTAKPSGGPHPWPGNPPMTCIARAAAFCAAANR
jgi:hypothetical protein